jgi:hypothetical protein
VDQDNRIRITHSDLESNEVTKRVTEMAEAQKIALVRPIGDPNQLSSSGAGTKAIIFLSFSGLLGGFIAFLMIKFVLLGALAARSENSTTFSNLGFSFLLAFAIGLTVSILDALSTKINAKVINAAAIAIPASIVLGLALGTIANFFYSNTMQDLYSQAIEKVSSGESEESVMNWLSSSTHFPRGIAWLICGIAAGLTVGVASKSMKRTGLTTGGGALGGFLGGFIFDFFPADLEWVSQMLGNDISIGSSPTADITLIKDAAVAPLHARIYSQGGRTILESLNPGLPCSVDGTVDMRFYLVDTSTITLGSTQIRFRERKNQKNPTQGVGQLS